MSWRAIVFGAVLLPVCASATPPTSAEVITLCADAEGRAHCGRRIEEAQMKKLPGLATRDGDDLKVTLFPSGSTVFHDAVNVDGEKTYALFDYLDRINAVILFTTDGDRSGFLLLQRTNGRRYEMPSSPVLSPDRQHLATVDFCAERCTNEVVVWRVMRDAVQRELTWRPKPSWPDASVEWKNDATLLFDCTPAGEEKTCRIERSIEAPGWVRANVP